MGRRTEPLPGTSDILPAEIAGWRFLEAAADAVFPLYGYGEIRTPVFERTDVFQKSIGTETDVVQKEMYTFEDRGGRSLTLRPEGTAGVIRALAYAGIAQGEEYRVYYLGPMFRGERPAAGRKRQFHQIGTECVGKEAPGIDAECIAMSMAYLTEVGITDVQLKLNSRGVAEERPAIAAQYQAYFGKYVDVLCEDCRRRLETNVWRILDCKEAACGQAVEGAPNMTDMLSADSRAYFDEVCALLDSLHIPYTIDPRLVRGLDYYCHTVFEIVYEGIGAQNSIAGGGRYSIAVPGEKHPVVGVGFAAGMERLLLARENLGLAIAEKPAAEVYLVSLGDDARRANLALAAELRRAGWRVLMDLEGRGLRAQMRSANKSGARFAVIRGGDELTAGVVVCRDLTSGAEERPDAARVDLHLRRRTGELDTDAPDE